MDVNLLSHACGEHGDNYKDESRAERGPFQQQLSNISMMVFTGLEEGPLSHFSPKCPESFICLVEFWTRSLGIRRDRAEGI